MAALVSNGVQSSLDDLRGKDEAAMRWVDRQQAAVDRARQEYPDMWDEGSPLRRAFKDAYQKAVCGLDERAADPDFAYRLTRELALRMGIESK